MGYQVGHCAATLAMAGDKGASPQDQVREEIGPARGTLSQELSSWNSEHRARCGGSDLTLTSWPALVPAF